MTVGELKRVLKNCPDELSVVVDVQEKSIVPQSSVGVAYAYPGFDWSRGQFRIEPNVPLVRAATTL